MQTMTSRIRATALFAAYQLTVVVGILLLPVAVLARQAGLRLPLDRVLTRLSEAHTEASEHAER
jgi:hypothetical protein